MLVDIGCRLHRHVSAQAQEIINISVVSVHDIDGDIVDDDYE